MADRQGTRDLETALDRYWDEILAGAESPSTEIDPDLATTVQRVRAWDAGPSSHPAFASTLWEEIMLAPTASPPLTLPPAVVLPVRPMHSPGRWLVSRRPPSILRLAAALLLVVRLAGAALAALYPLRMRDQERLPLFAPLGTFTAESEPEARKTLLALTLSDLPAMRTFGGMMVTDYPQGASSLQRTTKGPEVLYIAVGPMSMTVVEGSEPIRVIPPQSGDPPTSDFHRGVGEGAVLHTGTTMVAPAGSVIELRNDGSVATRMLNLITAAGNYGSERHGAIWRWGSVGMPQELDSAIAIDLRQVTLNPSAALPIPEASCGEYAAAVLDGQRARELSFVADFGWHNTGFTPLAAYLLKVSGG